MEGGLEALWPKSSGWVQFLADLNCVAFMKNFEKPEAPQNMRDYKTGMISLKLKFNENY